MPHLPLAISIVGGRGREDRKGWRRNMQRGRGGIFLSNWKFQFSLLFIPFPAAGVADFCNNSYIPFLLPRDRQGIYIRHNRECRLRYLPTPSYPKSRPAQPEVIDEFWPPEVAHDLIHHVMGHVIKLALTSHDYHAAMNSGSVPVETSILCRCAGRQAILLPSFSLCSASGFATFQDF